MSNPGAKTPSKKELAEAGRRKLEAFRKLKAAEKGGKSARSSVNSLVSLDAPTPEHTSASTNNARTSPTSATGALTSSVAVELFPSLPKPNPVQAAVPVQEPAHYSIPQVVSPPAPAVPLAPSLPPALPVAVTVPQPNSLKPPELGVSFASGPESLTGPKTENASADVPVPIASSDTSSIGAETQRPGSSFAAFLDRYKSKPPPLPPKVFIPKPVPAQSSGSQERHTDSAADGSSTSHSSIFAPQTHSSVNTSPTGINSPSQPSLNGAGEAQQRLDIPGFIKASSAPPNRSDNAFLSEPIFQPTPPPVAEAEVDQAASSTIESALSANDQNSSKPAGSLSTAYSSLADLYVDSKPAASPSVAAGTSDLTIGGGNKEISTTKNSSAVAVSSREVLESRIITGSSSIWTNSSQEKADGSRDRIDDSVSTVKPNPAANARASTGASAYASLSDLYAAPAAVKPPMPPAPLFAKPSSDKFPSLSTPPSWLSSVSFPDPPVSNGSVTAGQPGVPNAAYKSQVLPGLDSGGKGGSSLPDPWWSNGPPQPLDYEATLNGHAQPTSNGVQTMNGPKLVHSISATHLADKEAGSGAVSGRSSPFPFADGPSSRSSEFKTLQNYINELEKEKFELLRKIEKQSELVSTLSNENGGLTEDYNKQGHQVHELQQAMEKLRGEINAQMLVMDSLQKEREGAKAAAKEAGLRAKALANDIVALEEKQRHTRSNELKLQKELEDVRGKAEDAVKKLQTTTAERTSLQAVVNVLQAEKKKLTAQLKAASAGMFTAEMLEPPSKPQTADNAAQTDTVVEGGLWYMACEGDTLAGVALRFGLETAELAQANGLEEEADLTPGQQIVVPSRTVQRTASGATDPASQSGVESRSESAGGVSFPRPSTSGRITQLAITRTRAVSLNQEYFLDRMPTQVLRLLPQALLAGGNDPVLVRQGQTVLASIDRLLQQVERDKKDMLKLIDAKQDEIFQIAAENDELRGKLETQTQRLELAVQQAMFANARLFSPVAAKHGVPAMPQAQPTGATFPPSPAAVPHMPSPNATGPHPMQQMPNAQFEASPAGQGPAGGSGGVDAAGVAPQPDGHTTPFTHHVVPGLGEGPPTATPGSSSGERRGLARWIFGRGQPKSPAA